MKAIENLRQAGLNSVVLVVTLVKGVNDSQLGDIIKFAAKNSDVIRCINVQPVSSLRSIATARTRKNAHHHPRLHAQSRRTNQGDIKAQDFYPVPVVVPVSKAVGAIKDKRYVEFTAHPHCGMATFVFIENGKITPITRYGNIEKFVATLNASTMMHRKATRAKPNSASSVLLATSNSVSYANTYSKFS